MELFEILGYAGTAFVLLSFLMSSVVKLRVLNTIGSLISVVYLLPKGAYPTAFMNAALVVINVFHLVRMYNNKVSFAIVGADIKESCINFFINNNKGDILHFFPDFELVLSGADFVKVVYHANEIVGIFACKKSGNALEVLLDYTSKGYRDFSVGTLLFDTLKNEGITKVTFAQKCENHIPYLLKMGFKKEDGEKYVKTY